MIGESNCLLAPSYDDNRVIFLYTHNTKITAIFTNDKVFHLCIERDDKRREAELNRNMLKAQLNIMYVFLKRFGRT